MGYIDLKNEGTVAVERELFNQALEASERTNLAVKESASKFYKKIGGYNNKLATDLLKQFEEKTEKETDENDKLHMRDLLAFLKDTLDIYINKQGCAVIYNNMLNGELLLLATPGIEYAPFHVWTNQIQLISIDYFRTRQIKSQEIDYKHFTLLLELAVITDKKPLELATTWKVEIPKDVQKNMFYQNFIKQGYRPYHISGWGPAASQELQAILMGRIVLHHESDGKISDQSYLQTVDLWLNTGRNELARADSRQFGRGTARAIFSYIETIKSQFNATQYYQAIQKEIENYKNQKGDN